MDKIHITARLSIHEGEFDKLKSAAEKCVRIIREKDKGCLQYDLYLTEDRRMCVIQEAYKDSNAVLQHVANLGSALGELLSCADTELEVYGNPSPELLKATEGMKGVVYRHLLGL